MVRCGNRRAECCPSCAYEYAGDMWQLIYAGLAGGRKGVPESVAEHPQVFATLTAPSFGPVHTRRDDGRACRCGRHHQVDDPELGSAIDPGTYDYDGAVLWNWHAPALWNRFTTELIRVLARAHGLSEAACRTFVRVAYAKVAEFQCKGSHEQITRAGASPEQLRDSGVPEQLVQMAAAALRLSKRPGWRGWIGGSTCSASAATSSPSPAAAPRRSASCARPALTTAQHRTNNPATMTTRRR